MEALQLGCVGLAAVGVCCTAAAKSRKTVGMAVSVLMLLAMLDTALQLIPIPGAGWALLLTGSALGAVLHQSRAANRVHPSSVDRKAAAERAVHRGVGTILMSALLICMGAHGAGPSGAGHPGHHGTDILVVVIVMIVVLYSASSAWISLGARDRGHSRLHRLETAAMGASVLAMTAMGIVL